jgi:hypothetical protein
MNAGGLSQDAHRSPLHYQTRERLRAKPGVNRNASPT